MPHRVGAVARCSRRPAREEHVISADQPTGPFDDLADDSVDLGPRAPDGDAGGPGNDGGAGEQSAEGPADEPDADGGEADERGPDSDAGEPGPEGAGDDAATSGTGAPAVVAVVVTKNPGSWLEATLESLEEQDYEHLSVLVVDNGSTDDPTPRVADVAPFAFVKRIKADEGYSHAANEALRSVEGAPFLLFCHDDVRLAPDTVTQLVAEAFRANAGVVGPKLVDWDHPEVLTSVGLGVDTFGAAISLVDPGELDQGQHDINREVFAVSGACMLVRSDLFSTIGGFDERIPFFGEDVDLCWRTHLAGATVQFSPRAVARHRGRFDERRPIEVRDRLELRHQTRSTLTNYGARRLVRVVPAAFLLSIVEFVGALLVGRGRRSVDILAAWGWGIVHLPEVARARRKVKAYRRVRDVDYLPLMRQGSTRIQALTRSADGENRVSAATRAGRDRWRSSVQSDTSSRLATALAVTAVVLMVAGVRSLVFGALPSMREFTSAGPSVGQLLSEWWTGWRASGLGEAAVPPGVMPGLGLLGTLLLGSVGAARRLLILLPLLLGPIGAWRLFAGSRSFRAKAAALAVYGLSPIALNAMGGARLQALVAWAAVPWVLRRVAAHVGLQPVAAEGARVVPTPRHLAGTALVLALVCAISPLAALVVVAAVVVVLLGPAMTGQGRESARAVANVAVAALGAALVSAPWLVAAVRHGDASTLTGLWEGRGPTPSAADMLTGSLGPVETGVLGWGLVVAAAVPLFTGRRWRLGWALGGWLAVVMGLAAGVLAARSDLIAGAGVEVLLVPVAAGLAVAIAMGPLAFEVDVVRADFGARQILSFAGVVALVVGLVPMAVAAADGRWYLPDGDFTATLDAVDSGDDFRTLWIGDPDVLPMSGWTLDSVPGLDVGLSQGMTPLMSQRYRLDGGDSVTAVRRAVTAAVQGRTARLGSFLAPMSVRYVVVVDRPVPRPFAGPEVVPPLGVVDALEEQLDLSRINIGPGVDLFEVTGTWPPRADITERPGVGTAPPAVLGDGFGTAFSGELPSGHRIAQAVSADPGWSMTVDGKEAERSDLRSWSQQFATSSSGEASLRWATPLSSRLLQLEQLLALAALVVLAWRRGNLPTPARRRRVEVPEEPIVVLAGEPAALADWSGRPSEFPPEQADDDPTDWESYVPVLVEPDGDEPATLENEAVGDLSGGDEAGGTGAGADEAGGDEAGGDEAGGGEPAGDESGDAGSGTRGEDDR